MRVWAFWHIWVACLIFCLVVCFSQFLYQIGDTLFFDLLGFVIFTFTFIQAPTSHSGCVLSSVYFYVMFYEKAMLRRIQDTRHFFYSPAIPLCSGEQAHPTRVLWSGPRVSGSGFGRELGFFPVCGVICQITGMLRESLVLGVRNRTVVFFSNISCFSKRKE